MRHAAARLLAELLVQQMQRRVRGELPHELALGRPEELAHLALAARRSTAMNTVPTGFSAVPPSGPAMPLTAIAQLAPVRARAPSAISITVASLTAPCGLQRLGADVEQAAP